MVMQYHEEGTMPDSRTGSQPHANRCRIFIHEIIEENDSEINFTFRKIAKILIETLD
jgi:hypothetical protein